MSFWGCEKCGTVLNETELRQAPLATLSRPTRPRRNICPECGHELRPVSVEEALALARERAEAEEWRTRGRAGESHEATHRRERAPAARRA